MRRKGKNIFLIVGIILLAIIFILVAVIGGIVVYDLKQENILEQEIVSLSNKNILVDDYSIVIKTTGDYAYVESAIKQYYKELSDNAKIINDYFSNEDLVNILSSDNLNSDRPEFKKSYKLLDDVSNNVVAALNNISNLCNEEYIKGLIDRDKVDNYYYDLYKDLMYTDKDLEEFSSIEKDMDDLSSNLNEFLFKVKEVFDLLKENDTHWEIIDSQMYFDSNDLVNKYNKLYDELLVIGDKFQYTEDIGSNVL